MGRSIRENTKANNLENNETIRDLKSANKRLKHENELLKKELSNLQKAGAVDTKIKKDKKITKDLGNCKKCDSVELKELSAGIAGTIKICMSCNDRVVIKHGKESKEN